MLQDLRFSRQKDKLFLCSVSYKYENEEDRFLWNTADGGSIMSIFREITVLSVLPAELKPSRSAPELCAVSGKSASSVTLYLNVYCLSFSYDKQK